MAFKRRKSLLLFGCILCLLGYYAWMSNLTTLSISNEQSINILKYNVNNNNNNNDHRHHQNENKIRHRDTNNNQEHNLANVDESQLKSILALLFNSDAFLTNANLLNRILLMQQQTVDTNDHYNLNLIDSFLVRDELGNSELILNFGLNLSSLTLFIAALGADDSPLKSCTKYEMKGQFVDDTIATNVYLRCERLLVQVSIFYERGTFLWIGSDDFKLDEKYFGDIDRAVQKFGIIPIRDEAKHRVSVPSNIKRFLFDYEHSKFLECNRELAKKNRELMGANYTQNGKRNKMISSVMVHISETLESFYKHYFLAGGTLLGWYRDCGKRSFSFSSFFC